MIGLYNHATTHVLFPGLANPRGLANAAFKQVKFESAPDQKPLSELRAVPPKCKEKAEEDRARGEHSEQEWREQEDRGRLRR